MRFIGAMMPGRLRYIGGNNIYVHEEEKRKGEEQRERPVMAHKSIDRATIQYRNTPERVIGRVNHKHTSTDTSEIGTDRMEREREI